MKKPAVGGLIRGQFLLSRLLVRLLPLAWLGLTGLVLARVGVLLVLLAGLVALAGVILLVHGGGLLRSGML